MLNHSAPQRAFGGDAHGVGEDLQVGNAQTLQMRLPGAVVGEATLRRGGQTADHRAGERTTAHVSQRRVVYDVVGVPGAQQVKEIEPALARAGAEPGEAVVADLRAEAVAAGVPRFSKKSPRW